MKNYWLIAGGITIGLGIAALKKEEGKIIEPILMVLGGTAIVLVGIYGFKAAK